MILRPFCFHSSLVLGHFFSSNSTTAKRTHFMREASFLNRQVCMRTRGVCTQKYLSTRVMSGSGWGVGDLRNYLADYGV